jgi:hypothetical protein
VGNHAFGAVRVQGDFANDQRSADLYQLAYTYNGFVCGRLSQKVDRQAGGHGQGHDTDRAKNSHVERNIRHSHQQRARHGGSRSQMIGSHGMPYCGRTVANLLDDAFALRKFTR